MLRNALVNGKLEYFILSVIAAPAKKEKKQSGTGVKNIIKAYRFTFSSPPQRRPSSSNMEWVLVFLYVFSNIKLIIETESFVNGGVRAGFDYLKSNASEALAPK